MDTILNQWRIEEADELAAFYDALEAYAKSDAEIGGTLTPELQNILAVLGHKERGSIGSERIVIPLADNQIEVARGGFVRYSQEQIEMFRLAVSRPAVWGEYQEWHDHVIHFHMKRLHGEAFPELMKMRTNKPTMAVFFSTFPQKIDAIETDALSIHLMSAKTEEFLPENSANTIDDKVRRIEAAMSEIGSTYHLPGTHNRRGIYITAKYTGEGLKIDGDTITVTRTIPASIISAMPGKRLDQFVDIRGFKSEFVQIEKASQNGAETLLTINRDAPKNRVRINPMAQHKTPWKKARCRNIEPSFEDQL